MPGLLREEERAALRKRIDDTLARNSNIDPPAGQMNETPGWEILPCKMKPSLYGQKVSNGSF
jgi:hypothetical protein